MDLTLISPHGCDCHSDGNVLVFRTPKTGLPDHRLLRLRRSRVPSEEQFWMYDFDTLHTLPKEEFHRIKFGASAETILTHFERPGAVDVYPPTLLSSTHCVAAWDFRESSVRFFDASGSLITVITPEPPGYGLLYSVALDGEDFWAAFPTDNAVCRYTLPCSSPLTSLKDFNHPEYVNLMGGMLYVCDMGNHRLCSVEPTSLAITEVALFDEPVWEYLHVGKHHIVKLQSGIYIVHP